MNYAWEPTAFGDVLTRSELSIAINPTQIYEQITVRMWGNGVVSRGTVLGSELGSSKWYVAHSSQFILSKIDARNGAFGLVPSSLDGAIVSNDFPLFDVDSSRLLPEYLYWLSRTHGFVEVCKQASEGTTNRVRLKIGRFLAMQIPLPPLEEQHRIVAYIDALAARIAEARRLSRDLEDQARHLLLSIYYDIAQDSDYKPMREVAPIVRRPVETLLEGEYAELGVRSFGNGTFHKPSISGAELGSKRIFFMKPGDIVFSNVFAWEGAIAVVKPEDEGRVGSHRFITCVPEHGTMTPEFLCFHYLTPEGLRDIGEASPGGAGRNRTLGLQKLEAISVPVPKYEDQLWFAQVQSSVHELKRLQSESAAELDALLPSVLDKAFRGELL